MTFDSSQVRILALTVPACLAYAGEPAGREVALEQQHLRDELRRTGQERPGMDEQLGPFFLYVVLPFVVLIAFFGIIRSRS